MKTATRHIGRLYWWYRSREIGAGEIIIAPLLIIAAIGFHKLTHEQVRSIPFYRAMDNIMPLMWWGIACVVMGAAITVGAILDRPITGAMGFLAAATLFLTISVILWRLTHTYLTPSLYFAFALGAAKRAGELVGKWAARGDGNHPH